MASTSDQPTVHVAGFVSAEYSEINIESGPVSRFGRSMPLEYFSDQDILHRPAVVTIKGHRAGVFRFLRDFGNYPLFVKDLLSVEIYSPRESRWVTQHGKDRAVWTIEVIDAASDEMVVWRMRNEASGEERYGALTLEDAAGGRGTVVAMKLSGERHPSKVAGVFNQMAGYEPKAESCVHLRRLKAYLEAGEVPTTEGQSSGRAVMPPTTPAQIHAPHASATARLQTH